LRCAALAFAAAALALAACETVDLGTPPADVNACRPSQTYFVKLWADVLAKDYAGKKCADATCHDPATGRPLSLIANPQPAMAPTTMPALPLPDQWAKNYRSAAEQMSCANVGASNLIIYPTATRPHGGGQLFASGSPEELEIRAWVTAP
jgi:hypothetical protein